MCFRSSLDPLLFLMGAALLHAEGATLDLERAVHLGLESGEIRAESLKVEEARGRLRQAMARPNPTVVHDRQGIADEGIAPGFVQDLVKLEQSFLGKNRSRSRRELGRSGIEQAERELAVTRRNKIHAIRLGFFRALEAQEIAEAHRKILDRVREMQGIIETRVAAGESSRYEQARIGLALAQEEDEGAAASQERARSLTDLGSTMSTPLHHPVKLEGSLLPREASSGIEGEGVDSMVRSGTEATGMQAHPEVALESSRFEKARAEEAVARAERHPQLSAGLGYMAFEQTALPVQDGYNAILAVSLPIWDRKEGDIEAARAREDAARFSMQAVSTRLEAEIGGRQEQVRLAVARLAKLERTRATQLVPLVDLAETSYQAGLQTLLELLDAYRLERDFEVQWIRARAALRLALEGLAYSQGRDAGDLVQSLFAPGAGRPGAHRDSFHKEGRP